MQRHLSRLGLTDPSQSLARDKKEMARNFDRWNRLGLRQDELRRRLQSVGAFVEKDYVASLSSGTSGEERGLSVLTLDETAELNGYFIERITRHGLLHRHRVAYFLKTDSPIYSASQSRRSRFQHHPLDEDFETGRLRLEKFQPTTLFAPPSTLLRLAQSYKQKKLNIRPERLLCGAEVLTRQDRFLIEDAFGLRLYQIYQATEGFFGVSCAYGFVHLNEHFLKTELVDTDLSPRWVKQLRVTDLVRRAQPYIDYLVDDLVWPLQAPCPCGLPLTALNRVIGRHSDALFTAPTTNRPSRLSPHLGEGLLRREEPSYAPRLLLVQSRDPESALGRLKFRLESYGETPESARPLDRPRFEEFNSLLFDARTDWELRQQPAWNRTDKWRPVRAEEPAGGACEPLPLWPDGLHEARWIDDDELLRLTDLISEPGPVRVQVDRGPSFWNWPRALAKATPGMTTKSFLFRQGGPAVGLISYRDQSLWVGGQRTRTRYSCDLTLDPGFYGRGIADQLMAAVTDDSLLHFAAIQNGNAKMWSHVLPRWRDKGVVDLRPFAELEFHCLRPENETALPLAGRPLQTQDLEKIRRAWDQAARAFQLLPDLPPETALLDTGNDLRFYAVDWEGGNTSYFSIWDQSRLRRPVVTSVAAPLRLLRRLGAQSVVKKLLIPQPDQVLKTGHAGFVLAANLSSAQERLLVRIARQTAGERGLDLLVWGVDRRHSLARALRKDSFTASTAQLVVAASAFSRMDPTQLIYVDSAYG